VPVCWVNRPQTVEPVYYPSVAENSAEGTEVIRLEAFDHDVTNGALTYDITSGNPQAFFAIDRITGTLYVTTLWLMPSARNELVWTEILFQFICSPLYVRL